VVAHRWTLRRAAVAAAIALGAAASISLACGPGDIGDLTAGRPDAGVETGVVDSAICIHASAPERPTTPDGPNVPPLVFAFDSVRFDTSEVDGGPPKPQGLDLDHTCTCDDPKLEPESCIPPDSGTKRPCDGVDGRDNAAGPLVAGALSTGKNFGPGAFQEQVRAGAFNVLAVLQGWNGQPDDPNVVVGLQLSAGIEGTESDAGRQRPKFDGTDVWTVTPGSVVGGSDLVGKDCRKIVTTCIASKSDANAYVRGGVLVAHADLSLPIITGTTSFTMEFVAATVMARIVQEGAVYRLVGEIDGRWPTDRLLTSMVRIPNPLNPGHALCASDSGLELYGFIKKSACDGVDLTADPARDRTSARCDAISNAISFTSVTATVGAVFEPLSSGDECAGFKDSCEK
jgi:hypothetical protein